jgi:hypothetical protein
MEHWYVMMQPGVHFMTCFLVIMLDDAHDHVLAISNIWDVTPTCYGGLIGWPIDSRP